MDETAAQILKGIGLARFQQSRLPKLLLIGFLALLLQTPIRLIQGVLYERQATRNEAVSEVWEKWGGKQTIVGPAMVIPYTRRWTEPDKEGIPQPRHEIANATFLPETLTITGAIQSEIRHRGIYEIPVYRMDLTLTGSFDRPDFSDWAIPAEDILWDRAHLSVAIADPKALVRQPTLSWGQKKVEFLPSVGEFTQGQEGIHARLTGALPETSIDFSFPLALKGSVGAYFAPFGRETEVTLASNWDAPSFQGAWLPKNQVKPDNGFEATWNVSFVGRNYSQRWLSNESKQEAVNASTFGVDLVFPVNAYRMAERSVKYQLLFLGLTFLTLFLFEILAGIRIHSVQYLLVGAAMCLFYLLELSLAEHLGFEIAYAFASLAIIGLISSYSISVLASRKRAAIVGGVVMVLYLYLYTLLVIQDYALLAGSLGLFVFLAITMFLTRKLNWDYPREGSIETTPQASR